MFSRVISFYGRIAVDYTILPNRFDNVLIYKFTSAKLALNTGFIRLQYNFTAMRSLSINIALYSLCCNACQMQVEILVFHNITTLHRSSLSKELLTFRVDRN